MLRRHHAFTSRYRPCRFGFTHVHTARSRQDLLSNSVLKAAEIKNDSIVCEIPKTACWKYHARHQNYVEWQPRFCSFRAHHFLNSNVCFHTIHSLRTRWSDSRSRDTTRIYFHIIILHANSKNTKIKRTDATQSEVEQVIRSIDSTHVSSVVHSTHKISLFISVRAVASSYATNYVENEQIRNSANQRRPTSPSSSHDVDIINSSVHSVHCASACTTAPVPFISHLSIVEFVMFLFTGRLTLHQLEYCDECAIFCQHRFPPAHQHGRDMHTQTAHVTLAKCSANDEGQLQNPAKKCCNDR